MNSCRSVEFSACLPPFRMLSWGTGNGPARDPHACQIPIERHALTLRRGTGDRQETPRMALAPSGFYWRASASMSARSRPGWSAASRPTATFASGRRRCDRSQYALAAVPEGSPSRSSTASRLPVLAPDGTPATRCCRPRASRPRPRSVPARVEDLRATSD